MGDTSLLHWGLCYLALSTLIYFKLKDEIPKIYAVTVFYLLCTSNAVICFRVLSAQVVHPTQVNFLLSTTCFSALVITLFAFASTGIRKINCEKILSIWLPRVSVAGATAYVLFGWKLIPHDSSNVTMFAVSLPYLMPRSWCDWKRILSVAIILIAVVGSNTSSPLGVAAVAMASYFVLSGARKIWLLLAPIPIITAVMIYGWQHVIANNDRFRAYKAFMSYWWNDSWWNVIFGYASGSFEVVSQVIQHKTMFHLWVDTNTHILKGYLWFHLHSDALQYVFEYGLVGASLLGCCVLRLYRDLAGRTSERVVLFSSLSAMIFDFPVRYPALPLILFLLFGASLNKTRK